MRLLLIWAAAFAAAAQNPPSFDVASVKPSEPPPGDVYTANLGSTAHGELKLSNTTLSESLRFAYQISNDSQVAGPDWIKSKEVRFDVDAKAAPDTPREQLLLMLQSLLTERFQIAMHHDQRPLSYLALVPGKNGPKLHEVPTETTGRNSNLIGRITATHMQMAMLCTVLSRFLRQPIVDQTGLKGWYEFKLEWMPDTGPPNLNGEPMKLADRTLFEAIQADLGLKLEARKGPVDVLVVDRALKVPIGN
jgi:uncharacterized protein (TIGR03435 family)